GRAALLERMHGGLSAMGIEVALATAATPRAALWSARGGGLRLDALPLDVLNGDTSFLKALGISTLGELLQLPREGLAKRCGEALVRDLDRALGVASEPRAFFMPPASFDARLALPAEITHVEALLFPARRLLAQLEGLLTARQAGIRNFSVQLFNEKNC